MTTRKHDDRGTPRRGRGDDGAGLVEFSLIAGLLLMLLFGILQFGLILSFDQDVTRVAAEGARAGAVAVPAGSTDVVTARTAAWDATNEAVKDMNSKFQNGCGVNELVCDVKAVNCATGAEIASASPGTVACIRVTVSYPYASEPLFGQLPVVSRFYPSQVQATSVARINQ